MAATTVSPGVTENVRDPEQDLLLQLLQRRSSDPDRPLRTNGIDWDRVARVAGSGLAPYLIARLERLRLWDQMPRAVRDQLTASHRANAMAQRLKAAIKDLPGVKLLFPRQANAVFAELPLPAIEALRAKGWLFYTFIGAGGCRFMCSWDTAPEDVDGLVADLRAVLAGTKSAS